MLKNILINKYIHGKILTEGQYIPMRINEKKVYLSILEKCQFMQENCCYVTQMTFNRMDNIITFNGQITDGNQIVNMNGKIDFKYQKVNANVHWQNTYDSEEYIETFDENKKGRKI